MINNLSTYWTVFAALAFLILGVAFYHRRARYKKSQLAHIELEVQLSNALQTLRDSITKAHSKS
jgi:hypothetical protein